MNDEIGGIKERLEAATPGPWRWADWGANWGSMENPEEMNHLEASSDDSSPRLADPKREDTKLIARFEEQGYEDRWAENRALILNAPSDIKYLLTSLEEAQFIALGFELERDAALERLRSFEKGVPIGNGSPETLLKLLDENGSLERERDAALEQNAEWAEWGRAYNESTLANLALLTDLNVTLERVRALKGGM